jgi:hypothetical protein
MSLKDHPKFRNKYSIVFVSVIFGLLLTYTIAYAILISVDTHNGVVDTRPTFPDGWLDTPFFTDDQNDPTINDRDEIEDGWIGNSDTSVTPFEYYFRIQTYSGPSLSSRTMRAVGAFDCNNNGSMNDAVDRLALWYEFPLPSEEDTVWVYDGEGNPIIQMEDTTFGERVGTDSKTIEWRVTSDALPENCIGALSGNEVRMGLGTLDVSSGSAVTVDQTPGFLWNTHTIEH